MLGIDVFQRYQGAIDWAQVWRDGVRQAFVKLTNGAAVATPAGDTYVAGCRAAGILCGGYAYALGGDPAAQARVFAHELVRLVALDLAPALDFEDASLPAAAVDRRVWIVAFFTALKAEIRWLSKVLIYSSGSELESMSAWSLAVPGLVIEVWDAEYGANDGREHPIVHYTGTVAVHQYSSTGHLAGITGAVDMDDVLTDIEEDTVDWSDQLPVPDGKGGNVMNPDGSTKTYSAADFLRYGDTYAGQAATGVAAIQQQLTGLAQQVTALQQAITELKGGQTTSGGLPPGDYPVSLSSKGTLHVDAPAASG